MRKSGRFRLAFLMILLSFILPLSGKSLRDTVYRFRGTGRPGTLYANFREMVESCGGIFAFSTRYRFYGKEFRFPELFPQGKKVGEIFKRFCSLFPMYGYRFSGKMVNLYPSKKDRDIRGDGRLLSPDRWIMQGAALRGKKVRCCWEPAPGDRQKDFRIPLYRSINDSSSKAADSFCNFFTDYETIERGSKIYIFPRGKWKETARKHGESTVHKESGISLFLFTVPNIVFTGGYAFRFSRFILEPRIGVSARSSRKLFLSGSFSFCLFDEPQFRFYAGASVVYCEDFGEQGDSTDSPDTGNIAPCLKIGSEYGGFYGEVLLVLTERNAVFGLGWRF